MKTKEELRGVRKAQRREPGAAEVTRGAPGLLRSLIELANRQEHAQSLSADDSRAIVFQTMLVMREIALALAR
jgi:hypothetical protein